MPEPADVLSALQRADQGAVGLRLLPETDWVGGCEPTYVTTDGWTFAVFDDAGDWDYIDSFVAPNGASVDLWPRFEAGEPLSVIEDFGKKWGAVRHFRATDMARWSWAGAMSPAGWLR